MSAISDNIESFIMSMLEECDSAQLRRNELAQYFGCAPSQINYVLSTRFSVERGYLIQSKRGGGGYITIKRIPIEVTELHRVLVYQIGETMTKAQAVALLDNLLRNGFVTEREAAIMVRAVEKFPMVSPESQDFLRAQIMKNMFAVLLGNDCESI